jgi:hypothetical protein
VNIETGRSISGVEAVRPDQHSGETGGSKVLDIYRFDAGLGREHQHEFLGWKETDAEDFVGEEDGSQERLRWRAESGLKSAVEKVEDYGEYPRGSRHLRGERRRRQMG